MQERLVLRRLHLALQPLGTGKLGEVAVEGSEGQVTRFAGDPQELGNPRSLQRAFWSLSLSSALRLHH